LLLVFRVNVQHLFGVWMMMWGNGLSRRHILGHDEGSWDELEYPAHIPRQLFASLRPTYVTRGGAATGHRLTMVEQKVSWFF